MPAERNSLQTELRWLQASPLLPLFADRAIMARFPELAVQLARQWPKPETETAATRPAADPARTPKGTRRAGERPAPAKRRRMTPKAHNAPLHGFLDPHVLDPSKRENTLVCVARAHVPHQRPPRADVSPLAELYYLTQTLPLLKLIPGSQKVLTTETYEKALLEGKIAVVYLRIEELKRMMRWSLRQPERFRDPLVERAGPMHWETLLSESRWLAVDVKEQRKMKLALCHMKAQAVREYWAYGSAVCVKTRPVRHLLRGELRGEPHGEPHGELWGEPHGEPHGELRGEPHGEPHDEPHPHPDTPIQTPPSRHPEPHLKFLEESHPEPLGEDGSPCGVVPFAVYVGLDTLSEVSQRVLQAIATPDPMMAPAADAYARMPAVAVSKLLAPLEEADDGWYKVYLQEEAPRAVARGPQKGLFGVSHKRTVVLKPPKPPALRYLELRTPTIWLPQDDKYLIHYVAEFQFNWGVISAHLLASATRGYAANIERRTPWQCFERYIQLNDKFQFADMKGVHAFAAQRWLEAAHAAQTSTKRRISPLGVGNESIQRGHRRLRWASMFEAMRKCMRKRENAPKPNTAVRKAGGEEKNSGPVPTPAELARLKYERDKAIQEAYLQGRAAGGAAPVTVAAAGAASAAGAAGAASAAGAAPHAAPHAAKLQRNPNVPTTPNGTPYTAEQLQYLMRYQKQRKLLAQQNARAPPAPATDVSKPPPLAFASPVAATLGTPPPAPAPLMGAAPAGARVAPPPRLNLSTAQVSAIVSQIQQQNPNMSNDQIRKLAAQYISQINNNRMKAYAASQSPAPSQLQPHNQPHNQPQLQPQPQTQPQLQPQLQPHTKPPTQPQQRPLPPQGKGQGAMSVEQQQLQQQVYEQRKKLIFQKQQQVQQAAADLAKQRENPS